MADIIYRIPQKEIMQKLKNQMGASLFDVDGTLIDVSLNLPGLEFPMSWAVMERAVGFDKNEERQKYFKEWIELSKTPENPKLKEVNKKLDSFWKGKSLEEVSRYLYPIPFLYGVKYFFDEIKKSKKKFILGIISSAPDFYIKDIAGQLGITYFEACEVGIKDGKLTGEFKSNGLYGKEKSLENFCQKFSIEPEKIVYHGDSKPDEPVLRKCGIGIAVNPFKKFEKEVVESSDIVLYDWFKHPLLEVLR